MNTSHKFYPELEIPVLEQLLDPITHLIMDTVERPGYAEAHHNLREVSCYIRKVLEDFRAKVARAEAEGRTLIQVDTRVSTTAEKKETILEEAARLIYNDRNESYGHPLDNFTQTAALWTAYLADRLVKPILYRDVPWMQILGKASRDTNQSKRDNLTDTAGYAGTIEMCEVELERRRHDNPDRSGRPDS